MDIVLFASSFLFLFLLLGLFPPAADCVDKEEKGSSKRRPPIEDNGQFYVSTIKFCRWLTIFGSNI
jgi:hypothetical protein